MSPPREPRERREPTAADPADDPVEALIGAWAAQGRAVVVDGEQVVTVDVPAAGVDAGPPLLVLHGFPTSSIDFWAVLPALQAHRRVVLIDLPGFGLSAKPDRPYSLFRQADVVEAVARHHGLAEVDLLTHDMGDSVGGELLARSLDGELSFSVRRRVLTNGSIYLDLARLTAGQQLLASLPDECLPAPAAPDADALADALAATLAGGGTSSRPDPVHLRASAAVATSAGGGALLPRLIRYLHERRLHEGRFTGAIERHPAPLTVVWGDQDPIAVWAMTDRLVARRPDAVRVRLAGIGHYPMIEDPDGFAGAVSAGL